MAARLFIYVDEAKYNELQRVLGGGPKRVRQGVRTAINGTIRWAHRRIVRAVKQHTTLSKSAIEGEHRWGGITMSLATPERLAGGVLVEGKKIPTIHFKTKQYAGKRVTVTDVRGRKRRFKTWSGGVKFQIYKGGRWNVFRPGWIGKAVKGKAATAAEGWSGHIGVFYRHTYGPKVVTRRLARRGGKEFRVRQKLSASLPALAARNKYMQEAFEVDLQAELNKRLEARIARELAKKTDADSAVESAAETT